jgi:hypothetical protein
VVGNLNLHGASADLKRDAWAKGVHNLQTFAHHADRIFGVSSAIESVLFSAITDTWTAFEFLAGDLWEVAVNSKPDFILNDLKKKRDVHGRDVYRIPLEIEADWLNIMGHSIKGHVGTMLRYYVKDAVGFNTLQSISSAFGRGLGYLPDVLDIGKDRSLFNLAKTRNAIVHKAGKVDREFHNDMVNTTCPMAISNFAGLGIGDDIPIDGDVVNKLLSGGIGSAVQLITEVDSWL